MPRRETSHDRLERLRAEKEAALREKEQRKKDIASGKIVKPRASRARKAPAPAARMKLVWNVCKMNGEVAETYPYPQKEKAQADADRRNQGGKGSFIVRSEKVPMD